MTKNELKEKIKYPPRFTIEKTSSGYAIFDNEGVDDYYHINELEDMTMLVEVINDLNTLKNQFLQRITEDIVNKLKLSDDFFKDKECRCIKTNIQLESEEANNDD